MGPFKYHNNEIEIMAKFNDNYNPIGKNSLVWLFLFMAVIVILHIILPFPISFIVSIIVMFGLGIYRDDRALRKAGMGGIKEWYKSVFSSGFGPRTDTGINASAYRLLRFSCMNCC